MAAVRTQQQARGRAWLGRVMAERTNGAALKNVSGFMDALRADCAFVQVRVDFDVCWYVCVVCALKYAKACACRSCPSMNPCKMVFVVYSKPHLSQLEIVSTISLWVVAARNQVRFVHLHSYHFLFVQLVFFRPWEGNGHN